jgi:hypothetical protein
MSFAKETIKDRAREPASVKDRENHQASFHKTPPRKSSSQSFV